MCAVKKAAAIRKLRRLHRGHGYRECEKESSHVSLPFAFLVLITCKAAVLHNETLVKSTKKPVISGYA
jgi:hypothetical protein